MKKLSQFILFLTLISASVFANAFPVQTGQGGNIGSAPEMDASFAVIGLGLLSGVIALVAERRRGK